MNTGKVCPEWFDSRVIALSKKGTPSVPVDQIRPIQIESQVFKVVEKMILRKLAVQKSELLNVPHWQNGFKEGRSTQDNLVRLMNWIGQTNRSKKLKGTRMLLAVDLSKAFDTVRVSTMLKQFRTECSSPTEQTVYNLLSDYYANRKAKVGKFDIILGRGV